MSLPQTPSLLDLSTTTLPFTGLGSLRSVRHQPEPGWLWQQLHHKRWYYFSAADDSLLIGCSIVNLGYLAKGFVYVADRASGKMLAHHQALLPPGPWCQVERTPAGGGGAHFRSPTLSLRFVREVSGTYSIRGSAKGLNFALFLSTTSDPIVAANRLATAATSVTENGLALGVRGFIEINKRRFNMEEAFGGSDFTDGYLPRHTRWRWANVSGEIHDKSFGMNLVENYMGACECVVVIDGNATPLGEAVIEPPSDPMHAWRVRTTCERVDLTFTPFALHCDDTDLRVIHARFQQPIGSYSGRVLDLMIPNIIGVCENQDVLW